MGEIQSILDTKLKLSMPVSYEQIYISVEKDIIRNGMVYIIKNNFPEMLINGNITKVNALITDNTSEHNIIEAIKEVLSDSQFIDPEIENIFGEIA